MAILTDVREAIYGVVNDSSAVFTRQYDLGQVNRINWRKLVEAGEQGSDGPTLTPPYVVTRWGKQRAVDYGAANVAYEISVEIYYITSLEIYSGDVTDGVDKGVEVLMEEIETFLTSVKGELEGYAGGTFTYLESELDTSETIPINSFFNTSNIKMAAGMIAARLVYGTNG